MQSARHSRTEREWVFGAISAGVFFVLIGALFVFIPGLYGAIFLSRGYFSDFFIGNTINIVQAPNLPISYPAPAHLSAHQLVYQAAFWFSLVWGLFQICVFIARLLVHSPIRKNGESLGNGVFWLISAYLIDAYLITYLDSITNVSRSIMFVSSFWALIIAAVGLSLIGRGIYLAITEASGYRVYQ